MFQSITCACLVFNVHILIKNASGLHSVVCILSKMSESEGKVYVGNLDFKTREDDLQDLFEKYGAVSDGT